MDEKGTDECIRTEMVKLGIRVEVGFEIEMKQLPGLSANSSNTAASIEPLSVDLQGGLSCINFVVHVTLLSKISYTWRP
jgi:3-oxoacyl-ACP reductase-like protein